MSAKGKDSKEKKAAMAAVRKAYRKKQGRSNALASIIAVPVFIVRCFDHRRQSRSERKAAGA